jgi:hypothetical protein
VLRENHRFIRDGEEVGEVSWEERLARAYESKLFKEFALVSAIQRGLVRGQGFRISRRGLPTFVAGR